MASRSLISGCIRLPIKACDELLAFIRRIHTRLREIELGPANEQAFAGMQ
jgi:hypothetical protein